MSIIGVITYPVRPKFQWREGLFREPALLCRLLAQIFAQVGLVAPDNPWLRLEAQRQLTKLPNIGTILAEAHRRLDWSNRSQVVVFAGVLGLYAVVAAAVSVLFIKMIIGTAYADTVYSAVLDHADMSTIWLKTVFGLSSGSVASVQSGLGSMLLVYNSAILSLGTVLAIYSCTIFIVESGQHGTPGGKRHSVFWGPVRIVVASAMLVPAPIGSMQGWSGGQMTILWAVGKGSEIASHVWVAFAAGKGAIVSPYVPSAEKVIGQVLIAETCRLAFNRMSNLAGDPDYIAVNIGRELKPVPILGRQSVTGAATPTGKILDSLAAVEWTYDGSSGLHPRKACGAVRFTVPSAIAGHGGVAIINAHRDALKEVLPQVIDVARAVVAANDPNVANRAKMPSTSALRAAVDAYNASINAKIADAIEQQNGDLQREMATDMKAAGWTAAPVWFMTINRLNGEILAAAKATPQVGGPLIQHSWPEEVLIPLASADNFWQSALHDAGQPTFETAMAGNQSSGPLDYLSTYVFSNVANWFEFTDDNPVAEMVSFGNSLIAWACGIMALLAGVQFVASGSILQDLVVFAGSAATANAAGAGAAGLSAIMGKGVSGMLAFLSPFVTVLVSLLITAGAALAVALPMLPLVRWIYGCAGWLMGIFEAILAMPIFLLAHIRTDGEGFSAPTTQTGYMIFLSLALKPILMVMSLVISMQIFNVCIHLFNILFIPSMRSAQVGNFTGLVMTSLYMIFYCGTCYGIANTCFKAIDLIPNQVLRYVGGIVMHDLDNSHIGTSALQQGSAGTASALQRGAGGLANRAEDGASGRPRTAESSRDRDIETDHILPR